MTQHIDTTRTATDAVERFIAERTAPGPSLANAGIRRDASAGPHLWVDRTQLIDYTPAARRAVVDQSFAVTRAGRIVMAPSLVLNANPYAIANAVNALLVELESEGARPAALRKVMSSLEATFEFDLSKSRAHTRAKLLRALGATAV